MGANRSGRPRGGWGGCRLVRTWISCGGRDRRTGQAGEGAEGGKRLYRSSHGWTGFGGSGSRLRSSFPACQPTSRFLVLNLSKHAILSSRSKYMRIRLAEHTGDGTNTLYACAGSSVSNHLNVGLSCTHWDTCLDNDKCPFSTGLTWMTKRSKRTWKPKRAGLMMPCSPPDQPNQM